MVRAGLEVYARSGQRRVPQLILKVAHWHSAIETPNGKAMPEQVGMHTVPVLACLILALYFLQAGSYSNAIKDILDLP